MVLDAEDDGGDDDGGERGLGDVGAGGHEHAEGQQDQRARVHAAEGRLHAAGGVDGRARERPRRRHRRHERPEEVAQAQRDHLLTGVHRLPAG